MKDQPEREWIRGAGPLRNADVAPGLIFSEWHADRSGMPNSFCARTRWGLEMYRMAAGSVRLGAIALLAAVLVCGICCEGAAEAGERDSDQPRQAAARSQRLA